MIRAFVSTLLAAAALVPAAAQAQEHGPGRDREGGREQLQPFDGERQGGQRDGGQRFTPPPPQQQAPQPQFQARAQPQFQPQQQSQPQPQPQPQFQPRTQQQFQGQPQRGSRFGGQPGGGDAGRPGWNGRGPYGNGGFAPPTPASPPPREFGQRPPEFGGGPRPGREPQPLWNGNRYDRAPGWNAPPRNNGGWNRQWRGEQRYDWQRFRDGNRYAFRLPRYYAPRGWGYGYRRFSIGFTLDTLLFAPDYWIDDPYEYRLPPAYGPYRWVRYYNDALLVDIRSGLVVDTIYDIFW